MRTLKAYWVGGCVALFLAIGCVHAQVAGEPGPDDLVVARGGHSDATIVISPEASASERQAAADLAHYIRQMTGAQVPVANTAEAIEAALQAATPVLLVGRIALEADPTLSRALTAAAKPNPEVRADAIVLRRTANRILLAGNNDDSHYYAVADLLHRWGCRWYLPTDFGECIPRHDELRVGNLDHAYGSPFEVRRYWLSWNGDATGKAEFMRRNFYNDLYIPNGHALGQYTRELIPPGKTMFNVPISEPTTAQHVARQIADRFARSEHISLGMEDGVYESDSPRDKEPMALQFDKYFMLPSMTDAFMVFYNNVADILTRQYPNSTARIGFLAYGNMTLPPVQPITASKPLVAYLAPIDIDPIHRMDDPNSPPRQEYRDMLYGWAKLMQGRVVIYDYDQSMLVWRDFPNPSHQAFRHDVKHYRNAGILGVDVESRGAFATTFLNLYLRGLLMWNPDADIDVALEEFYPKFYGPLAEPMKAFWSAIYEAWANTIVTEHEHFVAPAIYTPDVVETLRKNLAQAEADFRKAAFGPNDSPTRQQVADRLRFTRLMFDVMDSYLRMVRAAATEIDYAAAVTAGERGLATREQLTDMNGIFTTYRRIGEGGPAWWPGEVQQYRDLLALTDGTRGHLLKKLDLEWAFRRDPDNTGLQKGFHTQLTDLTYWHNNADKYTPQTRKDYPVTEWEIIRTDLYAQAQGIRHPDAQSFTGHLWYRTHLSVPANQVNQPVRIMFPGLFNEAWLYVNGQEVAHRSMQVLWWRNDYRFQWDVDLTGKLKAGENTIALRLNNPHHFGGMFRRPFLYRPVN